MQRFFFIISIFVISQFLFSQTSDNQKHIVGEGESLYGISKKYHTSVAKLIEMNPQVDDGIKPGMELMVPSEGKSSTNNDQVTVLPVDPSPTNIESKAEVPVKIVENSSSVESVAEYHVVSEGETYYSLSRKYKTTVSALMALNNNVSLKIGEKIVVSKKETTSAPLVNEEKTDPEALPKQELKVVENKESVEKSQEAVRVEPNPSEENIKKEADVKEDPEKSKVEKYKDKTVITASNNPLDTKIPVVEPVSYNNSVKRILIIPFDPYLYFSDADMEIAKQSKMEHTKIRQAFRRRLNALLEPQGYETIHLLGGRIKDSLTDLNRIYKNVSYNYQDALYNPEAQVQRTLMEEGQLKEADKTHVEKTSNDPFGNSRASLAKDESKYYGVKVNDPNFFPYFNNKYRIDYYIFVNQFEVKTNYATCLDRTTKNYERNFITHFSIFDNTGKQISGNRIKIHYESNENNIQKILTANMQKVANMIIGELPPIR